jgi:ribonucleoside-diphosphate reductase alpha chain
MKSPALENLQPIAHDIWDMKYRLKDAAGAPVDETVEHTWRRVAAALAEPENPDVREALAANFYDALLGQKFLPAGHSLQLLRHGQNR